MNRDYRLYVLETGWRIAVKPDDGRSLFSFSKEDDMESYPRISAGEIYVTNDIEVLDLNSAVKKGIVSPSRPTLENRTSSAPIPPVD